MLRVYLLPNGRTYRFEEGEQPENAVLVGRSADEPETPEERASNVKARKRAAKKPKKDEKE